MKLIVGLGNPGKKYENTRHNVGFACVDWLQEKLKTTAWQHNKKFNALISEVSFENEKILLAKPQTYMNNSGDAVAALFNFYKCNSSDLWLIYDDVDLPLGKIRIRSKGSAGSHNGMKSVIASLGFHNFPRLRIGIENRETQEKQDITSFVLNSFTKTEKNLIDKTLEEACAAILQNLAQPQ